MDENKICIRTIPFFIIGFIIFLTASVLLRNKAYLGGFILGYVIGLVNFANIVKSTNTIFQLRRHAVVIIIIMFLIRLLGYMLGFMLAVKMPSSFHWFGVFIGYFSIKITIYCNTCRIRGR